MSSTIAILGAGPSGLALACLLEASNIDYVVYDRDTSGQTEGQGGSLDIHGSSGQLAIREAGLWDAFEKVARYDDQRFKIVDQYDNVYIDFQMDGRDAEGAASRPEVDRSSLRAVLLSGVPSHKIRWNSRIKSVSKDIDGQVVISFDDSTAESGFNLVVGADGAWSKVRHLITPKLPQYSGLTYLQTTVSTKNPYHPELLKKAGRGSCLALGEGKQLATQRMADGSYNIYFGLELPENWKRVPSIDETLSKRIRKLADEKLSGWSPDLINWIKNSDETWYVWPLYHMPLESFPWASVPGVTLVGDAAHVSTPFVGEGVNCALHDSLQLAQAIERHGIENIDKAVAEYEDNMHTRAIDLVTRSQKSGEILFGKAAAQKLSDLFASHLQS